MLFRSETGLARVIRDAAVERLMRSAHDISEGGLAVSLVESALQGGFGFTITLPGEDPTVQLFSESAARALVTMPESSVERVKSLCSENLVPLTRLGEVIEQLDANVVGLLNVPLAEFHGVWSRPIPEAMRS